MVYLKRQTVDNWKTTLLGIATIVATVAEMVTAGSNMVQSAATIAGGVGLVLAKDA